MSDDREQTTVIFLTDRKTAGAALRLVYRHKGDPGEKPGAVKSTARADVAKRFGGGREARAWLERLPRDHRLRRLYVFTVGEL